MAVEETSGQGGLMTGPLILITLGVLFLLNNLYPGMFRFGRMWPVILIVIGLSRIAEYFQQKRKEGE
jgi:cell wall-active antibiotic response 4TMS protein YvqF